MTNLKFSKKIKIYLTNKEAHINSRECSLSFDSESFAVISPFKTPAGQNM